MKTEDLIETLRATARVLQPFTLDVGPGSRVWDGRRYVESIGRRADPQSRMWWSVLNTIAAMLEGQGAPITPEQLSYLSRELFGGMGSFVDFAIDESLFGEEGKAANQHLGEMRDRLLRAFETLEATK